MHKKIIVWFRRDLRIQDHTALNKAVAYALQNGLEVIPLFIFDPDIIADLASNDKRVIFIYQAIEHINKQLKAYQSSVLCLHQNVTTAFTHLFQTYDIAAVFTNEDYEPYAIKRDAKIRALATSHGIEFYSFKDQVIFHKDDLLNLSHKPYLVFTPFKNAWLKKLTETPLKIEELDPKAPFIKESFTSIRKEELRINDTELNFPGTTLADELLYNYEKTRDTPSLDQGTSRLGIHLRFGTISIRSLVLKCIQTTENTTFLSELIWREFFMYILFHFPNSVQHSFKPKYDRIPWRNNPDEFERWKNGTTGYPLVDAGMRELNSTGHMHNRVRMLVASFLCKHLLIDWRWGEAYFASKLLDYELSSNVGNWQWACGSGVDAAPYFRIFNPDTQLKKFDADLLYVKKWVKEFQTDLYPSPIVAHKMARERCLSTFKEALQ